MAVKKGMTPSPRKRRTVGGKAPRKTNFGGNPPVKKLRAPGGVANPYNKK